MVITTLIDKLAQYLHDKLTEDKDTLQYKSTTNPEDFATSVPDIYKYTMPSSTLIEGYPARCPAIVITLDGRTDATYDITLNLCVSNVSVNDKEKAYPVGRNLYEFGTDTASTTDGDYDLIVESILFTDQIYNYMMNCTELDVSDINISYTDADLTAYPYATSSVSFKLGCNKPHVGQNPYQSYY